jgi:hypothetical protein
MQKGERIHDLWEQEGGQLANAAGVRTDNTCTLEYSRCTVSN